MAPPLLLFWLLFCLPALFPARAQVPVANPCGERCGGLDIPFPFHLNASCGPPVPAFRLSCSANSTLHLPLGAADYRVVGFLSSGSLLIDYSDNPNSSECDRWYSSVSRSFDFVAGKFFAVTADNVFRLYDCEDSSVCKAGCDRVRVGGACDEGNRTNYGCCYPLSDGSVWKAGDPFSVFAEFGCRGFSSWVQTWSASGNGGGGAAAQRGIEVEWAVPSGYGNGTGCADGAVVVNATMVKGGVRCACTAGFVGDGFAQGVGCHKSCENGIQIKDGEGCCKGPFCKKRVAILIGVLVSAVAVAVMVALCLLLRKPLKEVMWNLDPSCLPGILGKACNTRQFTYEELNEATKGFEEQKLADIVDGTVHTGVLGDGTLVAVQRVKSQSRQNLRGVLQRVELLSRISHRNIARIIGYCFESNDTLLVVHEHFADGTLHEHLRREKGTGLSWYFRINIASEVARALAYLQYDISTPSYIEDLRTSDILLDAYHSAKIAGFKFLKSGLVNGSCSYIISRDTDVVYNFGLILLELIMGSKPRDPSELISPKVNDKTFRKIVDPYLGYNEQLPFQREQIDKLLALAVQCLSSKENAGPCMVDVVNEILCISKENMGSSSRMEPSQEVTLSSSSLLQMGSVSPDSMQAFIGKNSKGCH